MNRQISKEVEARLKINPDNKSLKDLKSKIALNQVSLR